MHGGTSGGKFGVNKTRQGQIAILLAALEKRHRELVSTVRHLRGKPRSQNQKSGPDAPVQRRGFLREDRIDIAGPFPGSDRVNRYLLVAMDYVTKWPKFYAIPNQEAPTVTDALVN
jgi:hypothetical protein